MLMWMPNRRRLRGGLQCNNQSMTLKEFANKTIVLLIGFNAIPLKIGSVVLMLNCY